jgi:hypothetical protein
MNVFGNELVSVLLLCTGYYLCCFDSAMWLHELHLTRTQRI